MAEQAVEESTSMKAKSASRAGLHTDSSISAITSSNPPVSNPRISLPFNEIDTSNRYENRHLEIRELAYKLYEDRGRLEGEALRDWLEAEAMVRQGGKIAA
jgi:hypothetical protein